MAQLFNSDTRVVYIKENINQYELGKREFLLWPYYAYKVLVPMAKENKFNLFQKYILKMCNVGITKVIDIDEKLKIGKELTAYILIQLKDNGMIDSDHNVTHIAKQLLEDEENMPIEQVAGYIFQSVNTGKLENIFLLEDEIKDVEVEKIGLHSKFKYGTTGKPKNAKGLTIFPKLNNIERPGNIDILKAIIKYKRKKRIKTLSRKKSFGENSIPKLVNEVSIVSDKIPFWFVTNLFIPKDIHKAINWLIADPFGFNLNQSIRTEIIDMVKKESNDNLRNLVEKLTSEVFSTEDIDFVGILEERHSNAVIEIINIFGSNVKDETILFEKLLDFYISYQSFLIAENNRGQNFKEALKKVEEYLRTGYSLLEEIFYLLNRKYKERYPQNLLTKSSGANSELVKKIFVDKIGFNDSDSLNTFFLFQKHNLKSVLEYDLKEFRKLLTVTILTANEYPKHPLFALANKLPHFSNFLVEYKKLRDDASHSDIDKYPFEKIKGIQNYVYSVLSILLEDYGLKLPKEEIIQERKIKSEELILRQKAKNEIEREFGDGLTSEYNSVKNLLIFTKEKFIILQASKSSLKQNYLKKTIEDIIFNSSKVFEELFSIIDKKTKIDLNKIIVEDLENLEDFIENIGFTTKKIPSSFYKIKKDKILNKINHFDRGVLKEKIILLLLNRDNETVDKIALSIPNLIEFLSNLSEVRGHGGSVTINLSDTLDLVGELFGIVKKIINMEN